MKRFLRQHSPKRHAKSFKYAFDGIFHALINEGNFRVQVVFTFFVVLLGHIYNISQTNWALIVLASGILLSAEMFNTVIERFIDRLISEKDEGAKIIKDLSAGFVLISAVTTIIVTLLIFGPLIYQSL